MVQPPAIVYDSKTKDAAVKAMHPLIQQKLCFQSMRLIFKVSISQILAEHTLIASASRAPSEIHVVEHKPKLGL